MYTLYQFHFLNGISEINQLFDDILIIWPAPVYNYISAVKLLITINHIKNISFCLHNICVYCVYIYYVCINTHTCMYIFRKYLHAYIYIHIFIFK